MLSDFATARRHLERAQDCLRGDDKVTGEMVAALCMLIAASRMAESTRNQPGRVMTVPPQRAHRFGPRGTVWTVKKPFGS